MRESVVERAVVRAVEDAGGLALKLVSPGWAGAPDRLVLLPGGRVMFVEAKRPGEEPRPLQAYRHRELERLGFEVRVISTIVEVAQLRRDIERAATATAEHDDSADALPPARLPAARD